MRNYIPKGLLNFTIRVKKRIVDALEIYSALCQANGFASSMFHLFIGLVLGAWLS